MSFVVNHNTGTDTPITGVSELSLPRSIPNFGVDWRTKSDEPEEVVITNMNAPVAYPERFRTGASDIADIYKGTGISSTEYSASRKGRNILSQLTEVWTVTDTVDTTYKVALPVSCHIVLKVPEDPAITADDILTLIGRNVSGLFDSGSETGSRLQALMRGSLKPSDM
jgi:hypothetical protein